MSQPDARAHRARVEVRLKGALAERFPQGRTEVEVTEGAAVEVLIEALDLPRASYIFAVNGATALRGLALHDGDRVQVYPPMAGG
ncbi:MAG: MoaD/ThiS family protein [Candidatus Limnocylindrales bacterium]